MKVIVTIQQVETRSLEAEGPDYATARAAADAKIPQGWEVLAYRAER